MLQRCNRLRFHLMCNNMQLCSRENYSHSAGQQIFGPLWNLIIHYSVHKSQQLHANLSQLNPAHTLVHYILHPTLPARSPKLSLHLERFTFNFCATF